MARLKLIKHFTLEFLGDAWKDAFLDFEALTGADLRATASMDIKDNSQASKNFELTISLLQNRFIAGKLPNDDGTLADVKAEEIADLPMEIITKAVSFLSTGEINPSLMPSSQS